MKVGAGLTLVALQTMLFVVPSVSVSVALKSLSSSSAKKKDMSSGSENKIQIFSEKSSHTCCHPNLCISKNPFPVPLWFCFHSPLSAERNQNSLDFRFKKQEFVSYFYAANLKYLSSGWALSIKKKTSCSFGGFFVVARQSSSLVCLHSSPTNFSLVISPVSVLKLMSQPSPSCIWIFSPSHSAEHG